MLRDYQQESFEAAKEWLLKCVEPGLLELATGAGKSHIIAAIAKWLNEESGKKVLVLAPSKELVEQDRAKYLATGNPASMWCASAGAKDLKHDVVFGSPVSVKNGIKRFCSKFCAVIIDEAHGITPTIKSIVDHIKQQNKRCRVIGLTATPYRLGDGYIYAIDENDVPVPEWQTKEPYFVKLLHRVTARYLIDNGYLSMPHADPEHIQGYQAANMQLDKKGNFDAREVEQVFEGKGRLTASIVADIVSKSVGRNGVLMFAATRQHAKEVMQSLPPENSRLITGNTGKSEREKIIADFNARKFKYLVNVSVLTTGFDAPHVDVVAILRATESVGLLQQIIGRGLRLIDPALAGDLYAISKSEKPDCLVFDYAENIERHCPDGDLFNPIIKAKKQSDSELVIPCECPDCGTINEFKGRPNPEEFEINANGYFVDLAGEIIKTDDDLPMPAHFGRRCFGVSIIKGTGTIQRCGYRWSFKECHECHHENDIAAIFCEVCKEELVDPNEKLVIEFQKMKKNPYTTTTDKVLSWRCQLWTSQKGNETLRVDYTTEYASFSAWYFPASNIKKQRMWESLCNAVFGEYVDSPDDFMERIDNFEGAMPATITACKNKSTGFYEVYGHNNEEDKLDAVS